MGACTSIPALTKNEKQNQRSIDTQLRAEKQKLSSEVKLLLLGSGESGKSTIAKQMKILHLNGFSEQERGCYRDLIHGNVLGAMRELVQACERLDISIHPSNKRYAAKFAYPLNELTSDLAEAIIALYKDEGIQSALSRSSEFQLNDSAIYFLSKVNEIAREDYTPTEQDILRSRSKTTGINEVEFSIESKKFRVVDVGGQRSERKKWIHCFQDVSAVLFCVAMSEYDLRLYEDETVNRMHESLKLFDEICNCRWFSETSVILFLNKKDIFQEKIKRINLNVCFADYEGGLDYEVASQFMKEKFVGSNRNSHLKKVYPHFTEATDSSNIRFVFNATRDIILRSALLKNGF